MHKNYNVFFFLKKIQNRLIYYYITLTEYTNGDNEHV